MQAGTLTLTDYLWPRVGVWRQDAVRDAVLVVGFTIMLALVAQIRVPLPSTPVPITGQTFGVLLIGACLGSRRGVAATLLYLVAGSAGLPVFADWSHGLLWKFSSGGYIIGFVPAAYVVGWLAERGWDRGPWLMVAMLLGNVVLYVPGLYQLSFFVPHDKVLTFGLYPFIPGDLIKLYLASLALPTAWGRNAQGTGVGGSLHHLGAGPGVWFPGRGPFPGMATELGRSSGHSRGPDLAGGVDRGGGRQDGRGGV